MTMTLIPFCDEPKPLDRKRLERVYIGHAFRRVLAAKSHPTGEPLRVRSSHAADATARFPVASIVARIWPYVALTLGIAAFGAAIVCAVLGIHVR